MVVYGCYFNCWHKAAQVCVALLYINQNNPVFGIHGLYAGYGPHFDLEQFQHLPGIGLFYFPVIDDP